MQTDLRELRIENERSILVMSQNARSFAAHHEHVFGHHDFHAADLVFIQETRMTHVDLEDSLQDSGLVVGAYIKASTSSNGTRHNGSLLFHNNSILLEDVKTLLHDGLEMIDCVAISKGVAFRVLCVYRSPSHTNLGYLTSYIDNNIQSSSLPIVIFGDFNVDLLKDSHDNRRLNKCMETIGLNQHIQGATTNMGSLLDHIWASKSSRSGKLISVFSDHSCVWALIEQ